MLVVGNLDEKGEYDGEEHDVPVWALEAILRLYDQVASQYAQIGGIKVDEVISPLTPRYGGEVNLN